MNVAILGATGTVGQKYIELLREHPWFRVAELVASERSAGREYAQAVNWRQATPLPREIGQLTVRRLSDPLESRLLFSGLDSSIAGEAESSYAAAGHFVISNSRNHRMDDAVPLVIPEVNCDHLQLLRAQKSSGKIVTNPNCSTIALTLALAPLHAALGVRAVTVTTLQAISGAGYPGVASLDIIGNIIPYINGEEEKMESEPLKILGKIERGGQVRPAEITISAQCTRVPIVDGHTELLSLRLRDPADDATIKQLLRGFRGEAQQLGLPSAPAAPLLVSEQEDRPQVLRDVNAAAGMAVTVGRVRRCPVQDVRLVLLGHNTVRGAAGAAILNAEACYKLGHLS